MSGKEIQEKLKEHLGTSKAADLGSGGGGCISQGTVYDTDQGKVFVKVNSKSEARRMFDGEMASLEALHACEIVRVPKPFKVFDLSSGGAALAMEYLDMGHGLSKYAAKLGEQMARLHALNEELGKQAEKGESFVGKSPRYKYVDKFGFDITTCCGYIPQDNTWTDDWVKFYAQKMEVQMKLVDKDYGDREARNLWSQLLPKLPVFFKDIEVKPVLLHGDLWAGNAAENKDGPVIFDPASFYGHSEFELAISKMFGGFGSAFFDAYFKVLPQQPGFKIRLDLYQLFHYINHWNHFGGGYRASTISTLQKLVHYAVK